MLSLDSRPSLSHHQHLSRKTAYRVWNKFQRSCPSIFQVQVLVLNGNIFAICQMLNYEFSLWRHCLEWCEISHILSPSGLRALGLYPLDVRRIKDDLLLLFYHFASVPVSELFVRHPLFSFRGFCTSPKVKFFTSTVTSPRNDLPDEVSDF